MSVAAPVGAANPVTGSDLRRHPSGVGVDAERFEPVQLLLLGFVNTFDVLLSMFR
jgi:hypothetical protein